MKPYDAPAAPAFTLIEILVSICVLIVLVFLIGQLVANTSRITSASSGMLDADDRARLLFSRLASDLSRMAVRGDIDYYTKSAADSQPGNDQLAFYSEVLGYTSGSDAPHTFSLVAYRVEPGSGPGTGTKPPRVERLGKALAWNESGTASVAFLPVTLASRWPAATTRASDDDYEAIATGAFRFEYYFLLRNGALSAFPWDASAGQTSASMKDVAAVGVVVAVADRKALAATSAEVLAALGGTMADFSPSMKMGELETRWEAAALASSLPPAAKGGIRVYGRLFPLASLSLP